MVKNDEKWKKKGLSCFGWDFAVCSVLLRLLASVINNYFFIRQKEKGMQYKVCPVLKENKEKDRYVFSHLHSMTEKLTSLCVFGKALQGLEASSENALKPYHAFLCFSQQQYRLGGDDEQSNYANCIIEKVFKKLNMCCHHNRCVTTHYQCIT